MAGFSCVLKNNQNKHLACKTVTYLLKLRTGEQVRCQPSAKAALIIRSASASWTRAFHTFLHVEQNFQVKI